MTMFGTARRFAKRTVRGVFGLFGLTVSRVGAGYADYRWLQNMGIRTVIDIGASKGNASYAFHRLFPKAAIFAFEPLPDCFEQLQAKLRGIPNVKAFNIALGDLSGPAIVNRSSYSGSSSLRRMMPLHKHLFPVTAGATPVSVHVDTLDGALRGYELADRVLVKVDVQGYEDAVIRGGADVLGRSEVVIIETSFHELYEGQPLFDRVYQQLRGLGFSYHGAWAPELRNPHDGSPLQQDAVFINTRPWKL